MILQFSWLVVAGVVVVVLANPESQPYIPFRTSPFDQPKVHHTLDWTLDDESSKQSRLSYYDPSEAQTDEKCPLQFSLGISRRIHNTDARGAGIVEPPVIFPILPSEGPGRQVLYTTQYEHLDLLTPASIVAQNIVKEGIVQHVEFPLLFESSSFLTSPIVRDVNGDGILDAVLTDYDGGIYAIGLQVKEGKRYFHKAQVPRLYLRRQWMESKVNETLGIQPEEIVEEPKKDDSPMDRSGGGDKEKTHDPYHSYFEYTYGSSHEHETILRGVTADLLGQDHDHVKSLKERRQRQVTHERPQEQEEEEATHRRLEEVVEEENLQADGQMTEEQLLKAAESNIPGKNEEINAGGQDSEDEEPKEEGEKLEGIVEPEEEEFGEEEPSSEEGDAEYRKYHGGDDVLDDDQPRNYGEDDEYGGRVGPHMDDEYPRYDDFYGGRYDADREEYYDDKHYVRIPPHILCTPVLAEFPKLYNDKGEIEQMLFIAVSYYLDEDEYEGLFSYKRFAATDHGDETEVKRGMYVANAIMVYQFGDSPRWGRQEHLDLSGDHTAPVNSTLLGSIPLLVDDTRMGAFALSSPTVADIDGDGTMEVLMGTSMGLVYGMDARNLYSKENWPVQFQYGIESRILVEDVRGDTNLEIFVADIGGNIVCLDHKANKIWHRDLVKSVSESPEDTKLIASSPMVLGDVDGDGVLDIVIVLKLQISSKPDAQFLFALSADTGKDVNNFPVRIWGVNKDRKRFNENDKLVHGKLPAPLLVDLHSDQSFLDSYLLRNGTKWTKPQRNPTNPPPHGGNAHGLHIVQPYESSLVIMEAGSGCFQTIAIGEPILAMVQADDVHGTNDLDLVITTSSGNIVTLQSQAPFHPLNVWNNGEIRGRTNTFAHGYSASQGIFVHEVSRQFRDIFGVYVPITFEIFDNRPNIQNEPDKRVYNVVFQVGTSRPLFRKTYNSPGKYTERTYIPSGPGYYAVSVVLKTSHGLFYEDTFHLGYNVNYMEGFGLMLWLPLVIASFCIFLCGTKKTHWEDDDYEGDSQSGRQGILDNPVD